MPSPPDPPLLARLLDWYDQHRRELPWRAPPGATPDPYRVLLSEVMLQQTTVVTVRARFAPFLARFPTLDALAAANLEDVLHAWQGLGYYRRARALHAFARAVVERQGGVIPADEAALRALPGIGEYTAKALLAIAFGRPVVPLDANGARVLVRLDGIDLPLPMARGRLRARAEALAPRTRAGDVAQALMDLGAIVCRPRRPACPSCPWQAACVAHRTGRAEALPVRAPKAGRPLRHALAFLLARPDGAILFRRRPPDGLLGGLHELPSSPWREGGLDIDEALAHAPQPAPWRLDREPVRHVFTHFVLDLTLARAETERPPDGLWCRPDALDRLALPTVMKKLLRRAGYGDGAPGAFRPGRDRPR